MKKNEALQHGLGYAAGREDASGVKTVPNPARPELAGFVAFGEAFAEGWDKYNREESFMMTNARDAYEAWQASGGVTIFRESLRASAGE